MLIMVIPIADMQKYIHWKPQAKNVGSTATHIHSCQHLGNSLHWSGRSLGHWVSASLWETSVLTQLAHFQDLTQHLGQLYTTAAKGTFMLIFSATVLKHNLQGEREQVRKGSQFAENSNMLALL